jgi:hypothetical protein
MEPFQRIVEVYGDPLQYLGHLRIAALLEIVEFLKQNPTLDSSDMQAELMRSVKFRLTDTGLKEYPESDEEIKMVYEMFQNSKGEHDKQEASYASCNLTSPQEN